MEYQNSGPSGTLSSLHAELLAASHGLHIQWDTSLVPTRKAPQATLLASEITQ